MAQFEQDKGTSTGAAHTIPGEHSAPWDPAATWMEGRDGETWHDEELPASPQYHDKGSGVAVAEGKQGMPESVEELQAKVAMLELALAAKRAQSEEQCRRRLREKDEECRRTVSYTHLTLPTKA